MDTVTYPDAQVQSFINEHFTAIKVNIREPQTEMRELIRSAKPVWAPMFLFLDPRRIELRKYVGWLAPHDFLAELNFVLGMQDLLRQRNEQAYERFRAAADGEPAAGIAAEALFWAGAAAYKRGGQPALRVVWDELVTRHPDSTWARRADIWDMVDQPDRV
jgi:hypothetical protein